MRAASQTEPVTLFGDLDQGIWGLAVGADGARWSLAGPDGASVATGTQLSVEPVPSTTATAEGPDLLELCRVRGRINVEGADRELDLPGVQCAALNAGKLGSVRLLGVWFPDGRSMALAAVRPKSTSGQDRDQVVVLGSGEEQPLVIEPRLSTTYDAAGAPRRVGVELWLAESGDGEQRSRRVAAEATGGSLTMSEGAAPVAAYALRCHSRGAVGTGVYALLRLS